MNALLNIENLSVRYAPAPAPPVLDAVSLDIQPGETVGVIGESGSGKTTLARAILGLAPIASGQVRFRGAPLALRNGRDRRAWSKCCHLIFQDPQGSLNPRLRVWDIITERLDIEGASVAQRRARAADLMGEVGLPPDALDRRPHQFSGGQRQRIAIARGLALAPHLLILDEPTSALDMSIQAQVLNLLLTLQQTRRLSYLFISHDIAVIAHMCDRIAVMRDGRLLEFGSTDAILGAPTHPYTRQLIDAAPRLGQARPIESHDNERTL